MKLADFFRKRSKDRRFWTWAMAVSVVALVLSRVISELLNWGMLWCVIRNLDNPASQACIVRANHIMYHTTSGIVLLVISYASLLAFVVSLVYFLNAPKN